MKKEKNKNTTSYIEEEQYEDFISEAIDILVDLLKGKGEGKKYSFERVRRINYLVNIAKQDDLKKLINKLKSTALLS